MDENTVTPTTPYSALLSGTSTTEPSGPQAPNPAATGGYLGITQPTQADPSAIVKPAETPEEIETRKKGWKTLLEHPHFNEALMAMGAALAQPRQIGQTGAGQLGQAGMTGMAALKTGEYNDYQAGMQNREQMRKEAETGADVDLKGATAANTRAALPSTQARAAVDTATVDAKVASAKAEATSLIEKAKKAKNEGELDAILKPYEQKKAAILASLPEGDVRKAATLELDKASAEIERIRKNADYFGAHATEAGARTRDINAKAEVEELTAETLRGMDKEERKAFLTKSGKYSHTTSAIAQQRDMWSDIYDKLPAEDASKKGTTKEQFVMKKLTDAKSQDAVKLYLDYTSKVLESDRDPELEHMLLNAAKAGVDARRGGSAAPAAAGGAIKWEKDPKTGKPRPVQTK